MNEKSLIAQTKKASAIATFVYGEPISASIEMDVKVYRSAWDPKGREGVKYRLWLGTYRVGVESITFDGSWKEVLGLIEWLQDVEVPVKFRDR